MIFYQKEVVGSGKKKRLFCCSFGLNTTTQNPSIIGTVSVAFKMVEISSRTISLIFRLSEV